MAIDIRDEGQRFSGYVGAEVRAEAARQKISVAALARNMSIDRSTLNRYLTGERAFPVDTLYEAAEALDCDPGWLVTQAYERFLKDNPDVDYREHGISATRTLSVVSDSTDVGHDLSDYPKILAASTRDIDSEVEAWEEQP